MTTVKVRTERESGQQAGQSTTQCKTTEPYVDAPFLPNSGSKTCKKITMFNRQDILNLFLIQH